MEDYNVGPLLSLRETQWQKPVTTRMLDLCWSKRGHVMDSETSESCTILCMYMCFCAGTVPPMRSGLLFTVNKERRLSV